MLQANRDSADAPGEAWDWLCAEGLLARAVKVQANPDAHYVTRRAHALLEYREPLDMPRAQRRLGVELPEARA